MADEEQDPFSSIFDNCRCSSSQEELLSHAKFAREDETFSDDETSLAAKDSGISRQKLGDADDSGGRHGGESLAFGSDSARAKNLGFRGERKGAREGEASGTKMEGVCGEMSKIEPQSKKPKVSPRIHCSGKMVIEGEDDGGEVVVFKGDLKVEKASSSRPIVPDTEKLDSEDDGHDFHIVGEMSVDGGTKKKLEFCLETEVIDLEEDEEIGGQDGEKCDAVEEGKDHGEGSERKEDDEKPGDGMGKREEKDEDITRRRKRELPRSMFGLVWGEGSGDVNETELIENGDMEDGLKEASVEEKRDEESKGGKEEEEAIRCILEVLRVLVSEKCWNDDNEIDVLETARRRGITFPRSRFLPEVQEE